MKRIVRRRMVLGVMLLTGAFLFAWTRFDPIRDWDAIPLFGYESGSHENGHGDNNRTLTEPEPRNRFLYDNGFFRDPDSLLVGLRDEIFTPPTDSSPQELTRMTVSPEYLELLSDFSYIRGNIFLEDPSTILLPEDIDVHAFIDADLRIDPTFPGPHVLIFHTHSTEWFIDTERYNPETGIVAVGRYLAQVLSEQYGLEVLHHVGSFDVVDGIPNRLGSYERMEPVITALLAENPTVQLVIDLHRDGVLDGVGPFTHHIDGVPTARLMFFNGLSRRNVNGQPVPTAWLPNPYQVENLQLSFQAQLAANRLFPGLNRRIYLRAYRFSLHMHPRSLFVEVGNQYNTLQEAKNAMYPLARIIADVVLAER
ncbi:MAG: stage II sporulation protein P [Defluviitaleaceae bacterium]|nr:stage II sporulation protein P [Defluviitaleaceae bacterium]